ncbi:hypothetical protein FH972_026135 [Carpinus fangiana]|uniref:BAR domain-containing protein n=1 Tax=Carpinus fangiana TaxID=176857 RepID=A0A5N6L5P2_9ROSI|nr:hypothetical protein FH972_026135 [Carpinus fangiana]
MDMNKFSAGFQNFGKNIGYVLSLHCHMLGQTMSTLHPKTSLLTWLPCFTVLPSLLLLPARRSLSVSSSARKLKSPLSDTRLRPSSQYTNEAYDYPANLRESVNDLGRSITEKVQLLSSASSPAEAGAALTAPPQAKPQPKTFAHAVARAALSSSQALHQGGASGPKEDPLATALEKYAIAAEKVGEARLAQDAQIQSRFLAGWSTTLNTNLMFATRARKGVENARLALDAAKGKTGGNVPQSETARAEIEKKEDEFVAQTEEAEGVMKNVLDTPEPLRNLSELIAAQLEYHKRAYEILTELAPVVDGLQEEQEAGYRAARGNA